MIKNKNSRTAIENSKKCFFCRQIIPMEAKVCFHCFNPQNPWKYYLNIFGFWINLILCLITTSASYYAMKNIIASKKEGITAVEAVKKAEESLKSASQADATANEAAIRSVSSADYAKFAASRMIALKEDYNNAVQSLGNKEEDLLTKIISAEKLILEASAAIQETTNSLLRLENISSFNLLVMKAYNDNRDAAISIAHVANSQDHPLKETAKESLMYILDNLEIGFQDEKWNDPKRYMEADYDLSRINDVSALLSTMNNEYWLPRQLGILQRVRFRDQLTNHEKIEFFHEVSKTTKSIKVFRLAVKYMDDVMNEDLKDKTVFPINYTNFFDYNASDTRWEFYQQEQSKRPNASAGAGPSGILSSPESIFSTTH